MKLELLGAGIVVGFGGLGRRPVWGLGFRVQVPSSVAQADEAPMRGLQLGILRFRGSGLLAFFGGLGLQ